MVMKQNPIAVGTPSQSSKRTTQIRKVALGYVTQENSPQGIESFSVSEKNIGCALVQVCSSERYY